MAFGNACYRIRVPRAAAECPKHVPVDAAEDTCSMDFYLTCSSLHSGSKLYLLHIRASFFKRFQEDQPGVCLLNWPAWLLNRTQHRHIWLQDIERIKNALVTTECSVYACFCNLEGGTKKVHLSHPKRVLAIKWKRRGKSETQMTFLLYQWFSLT